MKALFTLNILWTICNMLSFYLTVIDYISKEIFFLIIISYFTIISLSLKIYYDSKRKNKNSISR